MSNNKISKTNDIGCQLLDLYQSHKQRWIPDTNQWIYTSLLKQTGMSDANKWTYSNLLKQNKTKISDANIWAYSNLLKIKQNMDVRCQSIWTYTNLQSMVIGIQTPHHRDLQLHPLIQQTRAKRYE